jgi:hypothetical protein
MCSWTSGESLVGSLSAPDEYEPIDFIGDGGFLIDCVRHGSAARPSLAAKSSSVCTAVAGKG